MNKKPVWPRGGFALALPEEAYPDGNGAKPGPGRVTSGTPPSAKKSASDLNRALP